VVQETLGRTQGFVRETKPVQGIAFLMGRASNTSIFRVHLTRLLISTFIQNSG
jgi:hypothetical protein